MALDTQAQRMDILNRLAKANVDALNDAAGQANSEQANSEQAIADQANVSPADKALSQKSSAELCAHFSRVLSAHNSTIHPLTSIAELPQAIADYLSKFSLAPIIYGGNNPRLNTLPWMNVGIQWREQAFSEDGLVAIAEAECAIADTGTLILLSSDKNPTRNNFLAEHQLVLLQQEKIVAYSEDAWRLLLQRYSTLPRAINFISGPSSSADVGLKLEYGAHGPRALGVFILTG